MTNRIELKNVNNCLMIKVLKNNDLTYIKSIYHLFFLSEIKSEFNTSRKSTNSLI